MATGWLGTASYLPLSLPNKARGPFLSLILLERFSVLPPAAAKFPSRVPPSKQTQLHQLLPGRQRHSPPLISRAGFRFGGGASVASAVPLKVPLLKKWRNSTCK